MSLDKTGPQNNNHRKQRQKNTKLIYKNKRIMHKGVSVWGVLHTVLMIQI